MYIWTVIKQMLKVLILCLFISALLSSLAITYSTSNNCYHQIREMYHQVDFFDLKLS